MPLVTAQFKKRKQTKKAAQAVKKNRKHVSSLQIQSGGKTCSSMVSLPSIALLFGCMEGEAVLLPVTRKLAGRVSDTPNDIPLMSLGLNFFLHDGARRKFLSSSCRREEGMNKDHRSCLLCVTQVCERITSSTLLSVPKASRLLYSRSRVALACKDDR